MSSWIRAGALQGYDALVQELGADPRRLLHRHGMAPEPQRDPEALISLSATIQLLEDSSAATRCPDFGLRLGSRQDINMLGPLAIVIQNAPNLAQAVADVSRCLFLHSPAYEIVLEPSSPLFQDCVLLRFGIQLPGIVQQRQIVDGCLALTLRIYRMLGVDQFRLRAVSLPHTPLATETTYRRCFGAPVHFAQPYAGLHVHRDVLNTDLKSVNPLLRQMALEYIAQRVPARAQLLSDRVRQVLTCTVGASRGTKAEVAEMLRLHPKTLQRRLEEEKLSFEAIREAVYKDAALRLLRDTDVPLKQLAGALGFSEQSALSRSCRRWFDASPSQIRDGAGQTSPGPA